MLAGIAQSLISLSPLALLLPLVLSVSRFKIFKGSSRILGIYVFIASATEAAAGALWYQGRNNLPLLHLYTVAELIVISLFYNEALKGKQWSIIIPSIAAAFTCFAVVNTIFLQHIFVYNTYARGLEAIIVMAYGICYFISEFNHPGEQKLFRSPAFWANTGFFLYFSGTLFLFLFSNRLLGIGADMRHMIWAFHAVLSYVLYAFISAALWRTR